jgi:hypothetical protein
MTLKNAIFWNVAPCRSCVNRRFGGTYRLHLQGRRIRERGTSVSRWLQCASFHVLLNRPLSQPNPIGVSLGLSSGSETRHMVFTSGRRVCSLACIMIIKKSLCALNRIWLLSDKTTLDIRPLFTTPYLVS